VETCLGGDRYETGGMFHVELSGNEPEPDGASIEIAYERPKSSATIVPSWRARTGHSHWLAYSYPDLPLAADGNLEGSHPVDCRR
jgi:hypothetical protein